MPRISVNVRWLARQVRPFLAWHIASFMCISAGSSLAVLAPLVMKWVIDWILPGRHLGLLIGAVVLIFSCHQGRWMLGSTGGYLTSVAAERLALNLRMAVLRHLDTLSAEYHEGTPVGTSMYSLQSPINEIAYFGSDLLPSILRVLAAGGLTLAMMLTLNARMTVAVLPSIPLLLIARNRFRSELEGSSNTVQRNHVAWTSFLQEHLSSIVTLQMLRQERRREREAFRLLGTTVRSYNELMKSGVAFTFYTNMTMAMATAAVIGLGGWSVLSSSLTVGGMVAFYSFLTQLFESIAGAAETYVRAQKTFASVCRVRATLALQTSVKACPAAIPFPQRVPWSIELEDVRFSYRGSRSLLLIPRLNIQAGARLAVIGENGAGKSTLAKLLARLYDPDSGYIAIAGHDVRSIEMTSFREHVCYAPSHPVLFDTSLAGNLRLGKAIPSPGELEGVLERVGLSVWLRTLPGGLNERVGPLGARLSSGQRQRLGIARAILQNPRVLLLDEATSSLDTTSEEQLLRNMGEVLPDCTIIVISHRMSTLHCVGRVVVLEAGRVIADASPASVIGGSATFGCLARA